MQEYTTSGSSTGVFYPIVFLFVGRGPTSILVCFAFCFRLLVFLLQTRKPRSAGQHNNPAASVHSPQNRTHQTPIDRELNSAFLKRKMRFPLGTLFRSLQPLLF